MVVSGVLADGIPWDMPYRCPGLVWNPYRRTYTILIRIIAGGRMAEIPLGRFLRDFTCEHPDVFKRNPENRHAVLREIAADPAYSNTGRGISITILMIFPRLNVRRRWRINGGIISGRKRK